MNSHTQLVECTRQYGMLRLIRFFAFLAAISGIGLPLALVLFIWQHSIYTGLRRQVSAIGVDPDAWIASLGMKSPPWLIPTMLLVAGCVLVWAMWYVSTP